MRARSLVPVAVIALALAGCGMQEPTPEPEPDPLVEPDPGDSGSTVADCLVGEPWTLDLPDYAEQAESYMTGLGIPITDFAMSGSQTVQFTADGLMSVLTDITSTGTLQIPDVGPFPVSVHSTTGGSGDWAMDNDATMTITNWAAVGEQDSAVGSEDIEVPVPDFSVIPTVGVTCQPGLLTLVGPESPFVPLFRR